MTEEREGTFAWVAFLSAVAGLWVAVLDFFAGGLSLRGAVVTLVLFVTALISWIVVERSRDARVRRGDCTCSPTIRFGTPGLDPRAHRPSCPVRLRWESERRENGCCGPPDRDPSGGEHGSTRPLTKRQRRDWEGKD